MICNEETGKTEIADTICDTCKEEPTNYENAPTIFDICKSEYESERTRTNTIDSKIAIITAIVTALIVAIFSVMDFKTVLSHNVVIVKDMVRFSVLLICSYGSLLLASLSLFILLFAILTRSYETIDQFTYLQVEELKLEKSFYYLLCANKYAECCKKNREVNEKRCGKYNLSVLLLAISLILFVMYFILTN